MPEMNHQTVESALAVVRRQCEGVDAPNSTESYKLYCRLRTAAQTLAAEIERLTKEREFPNVTASMLDEYLWKSVHQGQIPMNRETCLVKGDRGIIGQMVYCDESALFGMGDAEIHISKVRWQSLFPESVIERAARNFRQTLPPAPEGRE